MSSERTKKVHGRQRRSLVVHRLENLSKTLFRKHYELVTELIGSSPGIYALYDGSDLYYVGKSTDLRKRVKHHLKDRHLASWTHFSLYLVRRAEHIGEIESLLVRIASPRGNRVVPRGGGGSALLGELKRLVKDKQRKELEDIFGKKSTARSGMKARHREATQSLRGMVSRRTPLFRTYKGSEYKAILTPAGSITMSGKKYSSPTAAARVITKRTINGWFFWYVRNQAGDWVPLDELRAE